MWPRGIEQIPAVLSINQHCGRSLVMASTTRRVARCAALIVAILGSTILFMAYSNESGTINRADNHGDRIKLLSEHELLKEICVPSRSFSLAL